ncbi:trigger factor [Patescibacteria group bacterium]|nr:trigger factor [Patescibacteria group bacterium]
MKASIKKLANSKIEILFEIPWQEFLPYLDEAAQKLSKDLEFKGFRQGKAPREVVEREIGEGKILATAAELIIKEKYPEFVFEKKLEVIGVPRVEILKLAPKNPFCFKAKIDVLPEIKLPDYKKIAAEVEKKEVSVKEKEAEDALNWLQRSRAKFKDSDREAKGGDFLEIEYSSPQIERGKVFQDGFLLAKGHFVPGFEENLQGMKKGEEKEFTIPFPKDYFKKDLASKNINFKVKLKKVQLMELPELNDDFARSLGKFENLEDLRKNLKEGIKKEKEIGETQKRRGEILEKIAQNSDFEIPQVLLDLEKDKMMEALKQKIARDLKTSFSDYLKKIQKTEKEVKDSFSSQAQKRVKDLLVLREIGRKEEIKVSEKEIEEAVNGFLKNYPGVNQAREKIDLDRLKEYYRGIIYNEKVFQILENLK